jgi:hypothetical protein
MSWWKSRIFLRMLNNVIMLFSTIVQKLNQDVGNKSVEIDEGDSRRQIKNKYALSNYLRTSFFSHQSVTVEVTVVLQLNQGERKKCEAFIETIKNNYSRDKSAVHLFFLDFFFVTFFVLRQRK